MSVSWKRDRTDLALLLISRGTRSVAAGFLAVIVALYYRYDLHLELTLVGFLFGAGALGTPLLTYIMGRYADRYGRKRLLLVTLAFLPAAIAILIVSTNYALLMVSAALGGFGIAGGLVGGGVGASVTPMQTALLAEKTDEGNRTTVFSLFTLSSSVTGSLGSTLSNIANYHILFYLALVLSLLSFLSIVPLKENFRPGKNVTARTDRQRKENRKVIRKFMVTGTLNGASQGLIIPFLPIILHHSFLMNKGEIGDLFAAGGLITAFSMLITPFLTEKFGFLKFIMGSRAVSSVLLLYFPLASDAVLASLSYIAFTVTRAISLPSQQSLMMGLVNEESRSYASGTNQTARLVPSAAATTGSGVIQDYLPVLIPFEIAFMLNAANIYLYHHFFSDVPEANRKGAAHQSEQ